MNLVLGLGFLVYGLEFILWVWLFRVNHDFKV